MTIVVVVSELKREVDSSRRFKFDLDDSKKFCYRSRVSANSFFHGPNQYNWKGGKTMQTYESLYHMQHLKEFEWHVEQIKKINEGTIPDEYTNIIELPNLWEFYKAIGWDYKTKKWSK